MKSVSILCGRARKAREDPARNKLYIRVNWKDVQRQPGKLELCEHWKLTFDVARRYQKRVGFRVMMSNPDIPDSPLPEFLRDKIPLVKLGGWQERTRYEPRYDTPAFQAAFRELVDLLVDAYDGHSDVEYVDTFMYGFWGEGHTWLLESNPFPDNVTAENTFVSMLQYQAERRKKTPLLTNTQPDFSKVGNSELVDRTIRSHNWLRTDIIFIENEQIEALSNRPPWTGVSVEVGISDGSPQSLRIDEGVTYSDNVIHHVQDVAPCYFSLWNTAFRPTVCLTTVRPSWVWSYEEGGYPGLIIGFVNDGLAAVPGVLRVSVLSEDRKVNVTGSLDAGYPLPGKARQAKFALPKGTKWEGLRLKAELEIKGQRYPVRWACCQKLNEDGSLTLRRTNGLGEG